MTEHSLYRKNDYIAITLNPCDIIVRKCMDSRFHSRKLSRYECFINGMKDYFETYLERFEGLVSESLFYMELSRYGRPHLHGYVKVLKPTQLAFQFYLIKYNKVKESLMHIDIDTISDLDTWKAYISKDKELLRLQFEVPLAEIKEDL